jgi:hypothetical protein
VVHASRDEDFLAESGTRELAVELELDLAFDEHQELVYSVHEIAPRLAGRVDPILEAEPAAGPVGLDLGQPVLEIGDYF